MQWDFMVEQEVEPRGALDPPIGGYYWAHRFSFTEGVAGHIGLQAEGGYQTDPPDSLIELTKIAVFWLSGPPLAAELGDIPYPEARVAPEAKSGGNWLTIHARFDWHVCHVYRFRFGPESTNTDGSTWYGAWIEDTTDDVEVFLGRMLLPADTGTLTPFSVATTDPFDFIVPTACNLADPVSAVFGAPSAISEAQQASASTNRYGDEPRCATSRFTQFPHAVRHELAVVP
jgi:hypothetical protein